MNMEEDRREVLAVCKVMNESNGKNIEPESVVPW